LKRDQSSKGTHIPRTSSCLHKQISYLTMVCCCVNISFLSGQCEVYTIEANYQVKKLPIPFFSMSVRHRSTRPTGRFRNWNSPDHQEHDSEAEFVVCTDIGTRYFEGLMIFWFSDRHWHQASVLPRLNDSSALNCQQQNQRGESVTESQFVQRGDARRM
jgi:hypothetical protein